MKFLTGLLLVVWLYQGATWERQRHPFLFVTLQRQDAPRFDEEQAYKYLLKQTAFGPRAPGSVGHQRCLEFLFAELKKYAEDVQIQQFTHLGPKGEELQLANVIATFNRRAATRIMLTTHWDTRLWADQDPDPKNHTNPILGANDGASGVAVLLEIARQLKMNPPPLCVDIVFFDGEDLGKTGKPESFSVGSTFFARHKSPNFHPRFAINLDMVGDAVLEIPREVHSDRYAPVIMNLVFSTARELGVEQFVDSPGSEITDDHIPLNSVGIPAVNLIDFNYPDESNMYWHTMADTPDKCSKKSLEAVGKLLLHIVYSKASTL